jgi:hypothetical protein
MTDMNDSGAATIGDTPKEPEKAVQTFRTAFLVFNDNDGQWAATNDPSWFADNIVIEKIANPDEMAAASSVIQQDIAAQKTAAMIQGLMMQAARQAEDARMTAAIRQNLKV